MGTAAPGKYCPAACPAVYRKLSYCSADKQTIAIIGMRLPKAMLSGTSGGCTYRIKNNA